MKISMYMRYVMVLAAMGTCGVMLQAQEGGDAADMVILKFADGQNGQIDNRIAQKISYVQAAIDFNPTREIQFEVEDPISYTILFEQLLPFIRMIADEGDNLQERLQMALNEQRQPLEDRLKMLIAVDFLDVKLIYDNLLPIIVQQIIDDIQNAASDAARRSIVMRVRMLVQDVHTIQDDLGSALTSILNKQDVAITSITRAQLDMNPARDYSDRRYISPDLKWAVLEAQKHINIYDLATNVMIKSIDNSSFDHDIMIHDNALFISGNTHSKYGLFRLNFLQENSIFEQISERIARKFLDNNAMYVIHQTQNVIRIHNIQDNTHIDLQIPNMNNLTASRLHNNDLYIAYHDTQQRDILERRDMAHPNNSEQFESCNRAVEKLFFTKDDQYVVGLTRNHSVHPETFCWGVCVWNIATKQIVSHWQKECSVSDYQSHYYPIRIDPQDFFVVFVGARKKLALYSLFSGNLIESVELNIENNMVMDVANSDALRMSRDGKKIVVIDSYGGLNTIMLRRFILSPEDTLTFEQVLMVILFVQKRSQNSSYTFADFKNDYPGIERFGVPTDVVEHGVYAGASLRPSAIGNQTFNVSVDGLFNSLPESVRAWMNENALRTTSTTTTSSSSSASGASSSSPSSLSGASSSGVSSSSR